MTAPVVAFDLEHVRVHVGIGQRFGRASIVDRYSSEPLQAITNPDKRYVEALLSQWDTAHEQAAKRAGERR